MFFVGDISLLDNMPGNNLCQEWGWTDARLKLFDLCQDLCALELYNFKAVRTNLDAI